MQDAHDLWVARQHVDLQRVGKVTPGRGLTVATRG